MNSTIDKKWNLTPKDRKRQSPEHSETTRLSPSKRQRLVAAGKENDPKVRGMLDTLSSADDNQPCFPQSSADYNPVTL